jgi:nucleotide-binding universal stress UspA family protein
LTHIKLARDAAVHACLHGLRQPVEEKMIKIILLVIDSADGAARATEQCMALAVVLGSQVRVLYVMSPLPAVERAADALGGTRGDRWAARAGEALDEAAAAAQRHGIAVSTTIVVDTRHDVAILDQAARHRCDLIVLQGHQQDAWASRAIARKVILDSSAPVLVMP